MWKYMGWFFVGFIVAGMALAGVWNALEFDGLGSLVFGIFAGGIVAMFVFIFVVAPLASIFGVKDPGADKPTRRTYARSSLYPENWDELRRQVYNRDGYKCKNCGTVAQPPHCHHIVPLGRGGRNELSNLVTLCESCHRKVHPDMRTWH